MLKTIFKSVLPHLIAVLVFAVVAIIYCKPAMEGKVLQQSDITQFKGMAQDALNYRAQNGHTPLWTNSMFGGMPTYQITGVVGYEFSIGVLDRIFTLGLPEPISLFFLASIAFYFLAQILGFNTFISIIGALAYSYATYNPVIIIVGHITKMHAIAYLPFFIGSLFLLFKKEYLWGGLLTAISTALLVQANHLQITYYGIIIALFMSIYYLVIWIKAKDFKAIYTTLVAGVVAAILGLAVNAPILVSTYEYGKASIRGGSALVTKESKTSATGLNSDYALSYSMFKTEPLVLMFPNLYGASSDPNLMDPSKSKAIETLQQMPQELGQNLQSFLQFYWGGIGFTAGPPYIGMVICLLAFIGFSNSNNPHRIWIGATILLSCLLAAGAYLKDFNVFFLEHVPFYNKFRAPSMIMVIPTLLMGIMALYGVDALAKETSLTHFTKKYKIGLGLIAAVFLVVLGIYFSSDFKNEEDNQKIANWNEIVTSQIQDPAQREAYLTPANDLMRAVITDRKALVTSDLTTAFIFIILLSLLVVLVIKKTINQTVFYIGIGLLALIDLFQVNVKYLKGENFIEQTENETAFSLTPLDIAIKKDTSFYRVLDLRYGIPNSFNGGALIAYHHRTVGGYNPAKLSIYQDLIENQWYKFPNCLPTLNMMNTKYIITGDLAKDTIPNKDALGNAWFVKGIQYEKDPASVMKRLDNFNPKDTAIIEEKDKITSLSQIGYDSSASIALMKNDNDDVYYTSSSTEDQFAVFSEVYYNLGWKAYIDKKEAPIVKTNYVLRGLVVPKGKHEIHFSFRPSSIDTSKKASGVASILLWLIIGFTGFKWFQKNKSL
jgi:MFS family permease